MTLQNNDRRHRINCNFYSQHFERNATSVETDTSTRPALALRTTTAYRLSTQRTDPSLHYTGIRPPRRTLNISNSTYPRRGRLLALINTVNSWLNNSPGTRVVDTVTFQHTLRAGEWAAEAFISGSQMRRTDGEKRRQRPRRSRAPHAEHWVHAPDSVEPWR